MSHNSIPAFNDSFSLLMTILSIRVDDSAPNLVGQVMAGSNEWVYMLFRNIDVPLWVVCLGGQCCNIQLLNIQFLTLQ